MSQVPLAYHLGQDYSVNQAKAFVDANGHIILMANKRLSSGQVAGNFNGGGTGNKPIFGFHNIITPGTRLDELELVIDAECALRSKATGSDADETQSGVSWNLFIDLNGAGNTADYRVVVMAILGADGNDKYGNASPIAHKTDFNIQTDTFRIVLGLDGVTGSWTNVLYTIGDVLASYPNAIVHQNVQTDGGLPSGLVLPPLIAFIGDSSTSLRTISAITELSINGRRYV